MAILRAVPDPLRSPSPVSRASGLEAREIHHRYGGAVVLAGVSLAVQAGDCLVIAGSNGAGKTTLLRILAGLTRPRAGSVTLAGAPLRSDPAARAGIGFHSHQTQLYGDLTVAENLHLAAALHRRPWPQELVDALGLGGVLGKRARHLSRGMGQRAAIARALLHDPAVILLDEPLSGLDAEATPRVRALIAERLQRGAMAIIVSHLLSEWWDLATRLQVLRQGRWVVEEAVRGDAGAAQERLRAVLMDGIGAR